MAHTNMEIRDDAEVRLRRHLLEAERKFWADEAFRLQRELENIPRAVKQWGFVQITEGHDEVTLVVKPAEDEAEHG